MTQSWRAGVFAFKNFNCPIVNIILVVACFGGKPDAERTSPKKKHQGLSTYPFVVFLTSFFLIQS